MLVLSRKVGESVVINGRIIVTVARVDGDTVRLGIAAPEDVPIHRQEIYDEIQLNNREALTRKGQPVPKLPLRRSRRAPGMPSAITLPGLKSPSLPT